MGWSPIGLLIIILLAVCVIFGFKRAFIWVADLFEGFFSLEAKEKKKKNEGEK